MSNREKAKNHAPEPTFVSFTPAQARILELLLDGEPHTKEELRRTMKDWLSSHAAVKVHLHHIRKKLRILGQDVLLEYNRGLVHYRMVDRRQCQNLDEYLNS